MSKRKREEADGLIDEVDEEDFKLTEAEIAELIDTAPEVEALTAQGLRRLVLNLEKRYTRNQELRIKYAGQPDKFLESEVDLDVAIKELHVLATAPGLYGDFVKLNAVRTLVSLLQHENNDIMVDTINLLHELTQSNEGAADEAEDEESDAYLLHEAFIQQEGGLDILLSNLDRLDEKIDEERQGVYNMMGILENVSEVMPEIGVMAMKNDVWRKWVLRRMKEDGFDDNKAYASEIVSILLQNSPESRKLFTEANGIDTLLLCLAPYRKTDPPTADEEEYVENLFNSLCTCLMSNENKEVFRKSQGLELMLIMIKSKKFPRKSALKVVDFALAGNEENCKYFVDILGLKTLFAAFMKKGAKKGRSGFNELADDEHIAAAIASLFKSLAAAGGEPYTRLLGKFQESNYQKIERLLELHAKYAKKSAAFDAQVEAEMEARRARGEELTELDEEYYLSLRLDEGHLFTLQLIDYIIAAVATSPLEGANAYIKQLLKQQGGSLEKVKEVLATYAKSIGSSGTDTSSGAADDGDATTDRERANIRQLIERLE